MRALLAIAGSAVVLALAAPSALAAPPSGGCPSGYLRLEVAPLTAAGYRVPAQVDSPTTTLSFGNQAGNGNGWVCGVPLGHQSFNGNQIYNFMDDSLQVGE